MPDAYDRNGLVAALQEIADMCEGKLSYLKGDDTDPEDLWRAASELIHIKAVADRALGTTT